MTDRELALIGALDDTFPTANMLLCRWHINKNILAKHKAGKIAEAWEEFMKAWNALISGATTVKSYQDQLQVNFVLPLLKVTKINSRLILSSFSRKLLNCVLF